MKRALVLGSFGAGLAVLVGSALGAGPSPGVAFGSAGVVSRDGNVRYVALRAGTGTLVEAVTTRGGTVRKSRFLKGAFGIPLVAYDGSTGGLSRNGRRLVVYEPSSGAKTRFVVLSPRTLRVQRRFTLSGDFGFDALSPDGSLLYLIQYHGSPWAINGSYAVRAYSLNMRRLYPGALVDPREPDEKMTGQPVTRVEPGAWAYTLYSRAGKRPFVHALDTAHRRAFCVDLPWRRSAPWINVVRMRVRGGELLLQRGGKVIARVDRKTLEVRT